MAWPWMHIIVGTLLIVAVALGLWGPKNQATLWAMVSRVGYILIILSGIAMFGRAWRENPWLLVIKVVAALAFIAMAEIGFARRSKDRASAATLWVPLVFGLIVFALGLLLTKGFPLF